METVKETRAQSFSLLIPALALVGCSKPEAWTDAIPHLPTDPGWHYQVRARAQIARFGFRAPSTRSITLACGYAFGPDPVLLLQEVFEPEPDGTLTITAGNAAQTLKIFPEFHSGNLIVTLNSNEAVYRTLRNFRGSLRLKYGAGQSVSLPPTENLARLALACDQMRIRFARNWAEDRDP